MSPLCRVYAAVKMFQYMPLPKFAVYEIDADDGQILNANTVDVPKRLSYTEVKRDRKGRSIIVNHKTKSAHLASAREPKSIEQTEGSRVEEKSDEGYRKNTSAAMNDDTGNRHTTERTEKCPNCGFSEKHQPHTGSKAEQARSNSTKPKSQLVATTEDAAQHEPKNAITPINKKTTPTEKNNPRPSDNGKPIPDGNKDIDGDKQSPAMKNKMNQQPAKEFTSDDEKQLKALKAAGKSWREIAQEMKRPQQFLKNKFKEIDQERPVNGANVGGSKSITSNKSGSNRANTEKKEVDAGKKTQSTKGNEGHKSESNATKQPHVPHKNNEDRSGKASGTRGEKKAKSSHNHTSTKSSSKIIPKPSSKKSKASSDDDDEEVTFTEEEWYLLTHDDFLSYDEIRLCVDIILRISEKTNLTPHDWEFWVRAASKFFDKTGRRIKVIDFHDKFASIKGMDLN